MDPNGVFSIAMLVYQRVYIYIYTVYIYTPAIIDNIMAIPHETVRI
jgi:hypothetical protein